MFALVIIIMSNRNCVRFGQNTDLKDSILHWLQNTFGIYVLYIWPWSKSWSYSTTPRWKTVLFSSYIHEIYRKSDKKGRILVIESVNLSFLNSFRIKFYMNYNFHQQISSIFLNLVNMLVICYIRLVCKMKLFEHYFCEQSLKGIEFLNFLIIDRTFDTRFTDCHVE